MIGRISIFLGLLAAGFLALWVFVPAPKQPASAGEITTTGARQAPDRTGPGVVVPTDPKKGSAVLFQPGGECEFWGHQRFVLANAERDIPIYRFHALDSRSTSGSRVSFENVTIDLYRADTSDPADPRSVKASVVTASRAEVELTRDEHKVIIAEDKLMEFWNLTYRESVDTGRGLTRITLGHAEAISTADMIHLKTPDVNEPVRLEVGGEDPIVVTGNGLEAWIPSFRDADGRVRLKSAGVRTVTVSSNPRLVRGDTTLSAKGALQLKEDTGAGALLVAMRQQVAIESVSRRAGQPERRVTASGGFLDAVLTRVQVGEEQRTQWRRLDLRGVPARISDQTGLFLTCGSLTVLPDTSGEPFWITASGTGDLAPVVKHVVEGSSNTYRCSGKVHVIQVGRQHGFFLRSFGLTAGLPPEFDQLVLLEGKAELDTARDGLRVASSDGLTMLRSSLPDLRDYAILHGSGEVTAISSRVRASGNHGFVLRQRPLASGAKAEVLRDFRLGSEQPDARHRYDLRWNGNPTAKPGDRDRHGFHLTGSGSCQVRMRGESVEEVHLSSLVEDIAVTVTEPAGRMWQARKVDAWFRPDGEPGSFVASGKECLLELTLRDDVLTGHAEEIHHPAPDNYRLVGNRAVAVSRRYGKVLGRQIVVHKLTEEDARLRASHDAELHAVDLPVAQGRKVDMDLQADEIRIEPFLLPPRALEHYTARVPLPGHATPARYLFADGTVRFRYTVQQGEQTSAGSGEGSGLILRADRRGELFTDGRLSGSPATLLNTDTKGRKTGAESHLVLFHHDAGGDFITLHPVGEHRPVLRLLDMPSTLQDGATRLAMTASGPIRLTPDRILSLHPVELRSLDAVGAIDPDGYQLDARSLTVNRADSGEIEDLIAVGDVKFRWSDASGRCDELSIDLLRTMLTVRGVSGPAEVVIPAGRAVVRQLQYNYRSKMFGIWTAQGTGRMTSSR